MSKEELENIAEKYKEIITTMHYFIITAYKNELFNKGFNVCMKKTSWFDPVNNTIQFGDKEILYFDFENYSDSFGFGLSPEIIEDIRIGVKGE